MRTRNLVFAVAIGTALATGFFLATRSDAPPTDAPSSLQRATVLPAAIALPSFELIDHEGEKVDASVFQGQWDLVFFGFTNCPDICPATLQILATARRELAASGLSPLPRIVLVSVDPQRDTPDVLQQYMQHFGDDNLGLTGDLENIEQLTSALGIYFAKGPETENGYNVDHSAAILIVNEAGEFHGLFGGSTTVDDIVNDFPVVAPLATSEVTINPPLPGTMMGSAYLSMHNRSSTDMSIDRVESSEFDTIEMHETRIEDGIAKMRRLDRVTIPADETVVFERGGRHLMLMQPARDSQSVTLRFFDGNQLAFAITADVADPGR